MIILTGASEFPSGRWTVELAARFADRVDGELVTVPHEPAAPHVAHLRRAHGDVLAFGHAPPRRVAATLRDAPCPVALAPPGLSGGSWEEVVLGCPGDRRPYAAAVVAAKLADRLGVPLRIVVLEPDQPTTGWQLHDTARTLERIAGELVDGIQTETELRGRAAQQLIQAAQQQNGSLLVVGADPRPRWLDALKPSFTSELLHRSRELVVVVPSDEDASGHEPADSARSLVRSA